MSAKFLNDRRFFFFENVISETRREKHDRTNNDFLCPLAVGALTPRGCFCGAHGWRLFTGQPIANCAARRAQYIPTYRCAATAATASSSSPAPAPATDDRDYAYQCFFTSRWRKRKYFSKTFFSFFSPEYGFDYAWIKNNLGTLQVREKILFLSTK